MSDVASVASSVPAAPQNAAAKDPAHLWQDKEFGFHDLLDIINPLQHIPVVATLYRYLTGDTIGNFARVVGDTLFGGPIGLAAGVVSAGVEIETGKDLGDHVLAMLTGGDGTSPPAPVVTPVATAAAPPADQPEAGKPASRSATGLPLMRAATRTDDPRQAFFARAPILRRPPGAESGDLPGRALSSHVVPLEGVGIPLGPHRTIGSPFTAAPAGTPAPVIAGPAETAPPSPSPAIRATLTQPAPQSGAPAAPVLPSNPPVDISQKMLDALDKYARMQQKRTDAARGAQVDTVQ